MNSRILVGIPVIGLIVIIAVIGFSGQSIINDTTEGSLIQISNRAPQSIDPLEIDLEGIAVSHIDERSATINLRLLVSNPNYKSVILQFVKYEVLESGERIHAGQIGERPDGFVASSNYFTVLGGGTTTLSDIIVIRNTGNTPELWNSLTDGDLDLQVRGQAYYSLSSMTAGGENIVDFVLTL